ncbi:hypothetical protein M2R47_00365 [Moraxella sp. Tifton1]|nr:hypothetical protein [Moraxella sp. Tifton1]MCL1622710.1 hypothetical protein [Moraxella sp. Tifton1]
MVMMRKVFACPLHKKYWLIIAISGHTPMTDKHIKKEHFGRILMNVSVHSR